MKILKSVYAQLLKHARKEAPIEACGYLSGNDETLLESHEMTNIDQSPEHFSFDPKEQFAIVKAARSKGMEILAVYHSHPASPARPSEEDIRLTFDKDKLYVIASLLNGQHDIKAFWIKNGLVTLEPLEVIDG